MELGEPVLVTLSDVGTAPDLDFEVSSVSTIAELPDDAELAPLVTALLEAEVAMIVPFLEPPPSEEVGIVVTGDVVEAPLTVELATVSLTGIRVELETNLDVPLDGPIVGGTSVFRREKDGRVVRVDADADADVIRLELEMMGPVGFACELIVDSDAVLERPVELVVTPVAVLAGGGDARRVDVSDTGRFDVIEVEFDPVGVGTTGRSVELGGTFVFVDVSCPLLGIGLTTPVPPVDVDAAEVDAEWADELGVVPTVELG